MPFVPALDTVRVFMEHAYQGKNGVGWVLHFRNITGSNSLTSLGDLGTTLVSWWNTSMKPLMGTTAQLRRVRMRDMTTENGIVLDYDTGLPIIGTRSGGDSPANLAFAVKLGTGLAGRSARGRLYAFGFTETDVTGNLLNGTYITPLLTAVEDLMLLPTAGDDFELVIASYINNGQPRSTALLTPVVSVTAVDARVDTQRRRLPRGGA